MVTAGATEAIYLVAQLFQGWASVIPQPTFSEYEDACRIYNHVISYYDNDDMEVLPDNRVYWLCNPNNPTGNVMLKALMNHVIREHHDYTFVVDQSYEAFTTKPMLVPNEMLDCHNLILLHSMTKQFCIPGMRLGYITASPILIDRLRQLRQPWSVNALAIEAGKFLIENHIEVIPDKNAYLEEACRLHSELSKIPGLMLMDSYTNFMLCYLEHGTSAHLKQWLIDNYGILIRDASNFHGLDNRCFRVSAQTVKENEALIDSLKEYLRNF
jgi:threonine-phosphate decarboxylase